MKTRTLIVLLTALGSVFVLAMLYVAWVTCDLLAARQQVKSWAELKYQAPPPTNPQLPIEVVGQQFEWRIRYPSSTRLQNDPDLAVNFNAECQAGRGQADDVHLVSELHLWKKAAVLIQLKTNDVLHSFFIPMARIKQDVLPGKIVPVWFDMAESNVTWDPETVSWRCEEEWEFACAKVCGTGHAKMRGKMFVHDTKDSFLKWLKQKEEELK